MKKSTPDANVDRSPLPAQQSGLLPQEVTVVACSHQAMSFWPPSCIVEHDDDEPQIATYTRASDASKDVSTKGLFIALKQNYEAEIETLKADASKEYVRGRNQGLEDAAAEIDAWANSLGDNQQPAFLIESIKILGRNVRALISQHSPEVTNNESSECQIAKVIPVGHSYSVAIGSLGIKMFETLKDAVEVRDAINKAITAAGSSASISNAVAAAKEIHHGYRKRFQIPVNEIAAIITKHLAGETK